MERAVGIVTLIALGGCAGGAASGGEDASVGVEADAPMAIDARIVIDADLTDAPPKKGFGETCVSKAECESSICVFSGLSGVCSAVCNPPDCPAGFGCYSVLGGIDPGVVSEICVPENDQLCSPCTDSTECSGASQDLCLADADGQKYCARDCTAVSCPSGYSCSTVTVGTNSYKQCLPTSGACDCKAGGMTGATKPCAIPTPFGMCTGAKTCGGTTGWGQCQPPSMTDVPDGAYADENCDGIDGTYATGIFVAADGLDDATCGVTHTMPCKTIQKGIVRALETARGALYVRAGVYDSGVVVLQNSIDIYGGYDQNWVRASRSTVGHETRIRGGLDPVDQQFMTLKANGLVVTTIVADVVIEGPDATGTWSGGAGRSSYAVYVANSQGLVLDRVGIEAGDGADGAAGSGGVDGPAFAAPRGNDGAAGLELDSLCNVTTHGAGGPTVANSCGGGPSTTSGRGGDGGEIDTDCVCVLGACTCLPNGCAATGGDNGGSAAQLVPNQFGQGGIGGTGGNQCGTPGVGLPGKVTNGSAGSKGSGSQLVGAYWAARSGSSGGVGSNGGGGGGGAGSGGCDSGTDSYGAGGGSGGAGGCAAQSGGGGGHGGGASFGVFAINSGVSVLSCAIAQGAGGRGGAGGKGGRGQSGGDGGDGGQAQSGTQPGGKGGKGGHGGHGGGGGGGAGGVSFGVYSSGSAITSTCTFTGGAGGSGGDGGPSAPTAPVPERDGANGPSGDPGAKGTIGACASPGNC
jgi:hypothetical protein